MSETITATTQHHASSDRAYADIRAVDRLEVPREIEDATALTVASWWQGSDSVGRALAQLSTTGSVDVTELLDGIYATRQSYGLTDGIQATALDCLATWAINHPSRKEN
jgi:hypothetical protein